MRGHLNAEAAAPLTNAELASLPVGDDDCLMPAPPAAGQPPASLCKLNSREADHRYAYRSAVGGILGYVLRWEACNGHRKEFRPITCWRDGEGKIGWRAKTWPGPRPLFGLDQLAAHPDAIVLLVEGEKTAEAVDMGPLADAFKWGTHAVVGVTWPGGGKAINFTESVRRFLAAGGPRGRNSA
jgi:hypothetical protein